MGDSEPTPETDAGDEPVAQELRTLSFRMREIQRLLNVRVEQENRRLEAEGLDPVTERSFGLEGTAAERESE